jgi:hypothetical protein
MGRDIFISYRRDDEPGMARALYNELERVFSEASLFMDVEGGIPPGRDFVRIIDDQVSQCQIMLAIVGRGWLAAVDTDGRRRLDNPDDFVRIEIESAMRLGKLVIPVVLNKMEPVRAVDLPEPMKQFARLHAFRLTHERFKSDTQGLIKAVQQALAEFETIGAAEQERTRQEAQIRARAQKEAQHQPADPEKRRKSPENRRDVDPAGLQLSEKQVRLDNGRKIAFAPVDKRKWVCAESSIPIAIFVIFATTSLFLEMRWRFVQHTGFLADLFDVLDSGAFAGSVLAAMAVGLIIWMERQSITTKDSAVYWLAFILIANLGISASAVLFLPILNGRLWGQAIAGLITVASAIFIAGPSRHALTAGEVAIYWLGLLFVGYVTLPNPSLDTDAGNLSAGVYLLALGSGILLAARNRADGEAVPVYILGLFLAGNLLAAAIASSGVGVTIWNSIALVLSLITLVQYKFGFNRRQLAIYPVIFLLALSNIPPLSSTTIVSSFTVSSCGWAIAPVVAIILLSIDGLRRKPV